MSTIQRAIENQLTEGHQAFVPYIMAGDRGLQKLKEDILFLQEAGVTAIEVGIPFSDPVADGPVIQAAGERALRKGVTLRKILMTLQEIRSQVKIPLVVMSYLNPIMRYGLEQFAKDAKIAGVEGVIIPDVPLEEYSVVKPILTAEEIALIPLVSLTSPTERIHKIAAAAEGFIYAVTVNGVTGERTSFDEQLMEHLQKLKEKSPVPVLAGFGISTEEQIRAFEKNVDGVIVGSSIVKALENGELEKIKRLINATKIVCI